MHEIETAVKSGHNIRQINRGAADWRITGSTPSGSRFVVVYDHPIKGSVEVARIVTAWRVSGPH